MSGGSIFSSTHGPDGEVPDRSNIGVYREAAAPAHPQSQLQQQTQIAAVGGPLTATTPVPVQGQVKLTTDRFGGDFNIDSLEPFGGVNIVPVLDR